MYWGLFSLLKKYNLVEIWKIHNYTELNLKMYVTILSGSWKKVIPLALISGSILLIISYYELLTYKILLDLQKHIMDGNEHTRDNNGQLYLISNPKCKIIDLDPFSQDAKKYFKPMKYRTCSEKELLTYVTKEDNIAIVHVDSDVLAQYTNESSIACCYSDVRRSNYARNPDDSIRLTACKPFQDNVTITEEAIIIKCTEPNSQRLIYENVHTSVITTRNVQEKMHLFDNSSSKPISVLLIGIDSVSRLNFIRALPNTHRYVEDNGWIPLKGYNKMADNTFPNLMAILTGYNESMSNKICNPRAEGYLDKCSMIWYKYRDLGYVTGYAEDDATIGTFNNDKKGFLNKPTDYYFRPYIMATETLKDNVVNRMAYYYHSYCTGPETAGERILNLAKDFAVTFKDNPYFGFFWMNTFSHSDISVPSMMDDKLKLFLENLNSSGVTNSSIIIFLSDHGIRFGGIRMTQTGWLEERLPFIYFSFPPWFKQKFPEEYNNFLNNVNRLTTPYDLHMSLQHLLTMSGLNYIITPSDACPECSSLFKNVPAERSCEEAGIADHWCMCAGYNETKLDPKSEQKISSFFIDIINDQVKELSKNKNVCAKYAAAELTIRLGTDFSYKNTSYALVLLKTHPFAVFETTISFYGDITNSTLKAGDVSRLDSYRTHSHCVSDSRLKKLCHCT
ncbi:unnamed protein product [Ceutorhynchus assimilis]|uniref:DUF229 domain containing protein n=1 Tax=Ceutorhynchus assimilis TaxID=467358 RepID=A0A9N9MWP4_9CUCU|nr:unnamed protein product [Ceutorhynchus assimilis]